MSVFDGFLWIDNFSNIDFLKQTNLTKEVYIWARYSARVFRKFNYIHNLDWSDSLPNIYDPLIFFDLNRNNEVFKKIQNVNHKYKMFFEHCTLPSLFELPFKNTETKFTDFTNFSDHFVPIDISSHDICSKKGFQKILWEIREVSRRYSDKIILIKADVAVLIFFWKTVFSGYP